MEQLWQKRVKALGLTPKQLQIILGLTSREVVNRWFRGASAPNDETQAKIKKLEIKLRIHGDPK